ncbi:MAG: DUF3127 domain-containing protein [Sphingobacteriales bacterium]|nr:MAG: DUF3127 domain-containing protein [Sphingobacteriales bacterium]
MEITGRIIQLLPLQEGTNRSGNPWRKQEFILETESQYPKKVLVMLWGDKVEQFKVQEGQKVTAYIDLESREYNGRWYTEVRAWKLVSGNENDSNNSQPPPEDEDGMPF